MLLQHCTGGDARMSPRLAGYFLALGLWLPPSPLLCACACVCVCLSVCLFDYMYSERHTTSSSSEHCNGNCAIDAAATASVTLRI
jgi:hypothetical protein